MASPEGTTELNELIEAIREEANGDRGELYELHGSEIRPVLKPLAELLQRSANTQPELTEMVALALFGRGGSGTYAKLSSELEAKDAAVESGVENPKKLWKFQWDVGRMGMVESTFVATQSEINEVIGSEVYFGEILGKHSDIYGTLDAEDLQVISEDQDEIAVFERTVGSTGHNPLDYIEL